MTTTPTNDDRGNRESKPMEDEQRAAYESLDPRLREGVDAVLAQMERDRPEDARKAVEKCLDVLVDFNVRASRALASWDDFQSPDDKEMWDWEWDGGIRLARENLRALELKKANHVRPRLRAL
jgi:hypothetical protein